MKRVLALLCAMLLVLTCAAAAEQDDRPFALRAGDRNEKKICLTMDDNWDADIVRETFELSKEYDIPITFFVLGAVLTEENQELWREIADSDCEIGNHTNAHNKMTEMSQEKIIRNIMITQEKLDALLGYHYGMVSLRPPYGAIYDSNRSNGKVARAVRKTSYWHVVMWDVDTTDYSKALKNTKNGSVLLFHAKKADLKCIKRLVPVLLEKGFEFVTTSEMFGLGEIERSDELYVFNKNDYK